MKGVNVWIIGFSVVIILSSTTIAVLELPEKYVWVQTVSVISAGVAASLLASALIQISVSGEQTELLKELSLDIDGIDTLPEEFFRLKWIAYATGGMKTEFYEWRSREIIKKSEISSKMVSYIFPSENLMGQDAFYTCTFVGLKSTVLGIISLGQEPSSIMIFDTSVPPSGIYFGPGYLTNWFADRTITLAIVGTGKKVFSRDKPDDLPEEMNRMLSEWNKKVKYDLSKIIQDIKKGEK